MKYLDDKMFKDLSVTAHKWLPITEVGLSDDVMYRGRGSLEYFFYSTLHKKLGDIRIFLSFCIGEMCREKIHFIGDQNDSYWLKNIIVKVVHSNINIHTHKYCIMRKRTLIFTEDVLIPYDNI